MTDPVSKQVQKQLLRTNFLAIVHILGQMILVESNQLQLALLQQKVFDKFLVCLLQIIMPIQARHCQTVAN